MKLFLIFAFFVSGLSAQTYLIQNHFSDLINKCSAQLNAIQTPIVNMIRDRIVATYNEFPKFGSVLAQAKTSLTGGSSLFTPIESVMSQSYNKLQSDFTDHLIRLDIKSVFDTVTEGFFNPQQKLVNEYKKSVERVARRTDCYNREKEAIRVIVEHLCTTTTTGTQNEFKDWEEALADIQGQLGSLRYALAGELKECTTRDCFNEAVRANKYFYSTIKISR